MAVIRSRRVRDALEWVDWFNNRRLLEPIGNIPPAEAEEFIGLNDDDLRKDLAVHWLHLAFPLSRLESVRSRQSERLKRRNENIQWPPMPSFLSRKFCRWPQPCLEPHCLFFVSTLSG